ncbi:MAG: primase-helicase family protein, partial [Puniceicoccales bacterium]
TYRQQGVEPCDVIDAEGQAAIDMLKAHIAFTLSDKREQRILLDWLAYVVQNPGKRVNWALLLQGAQGTGKSYFCVLLQQIMGEHVKNLDPKALKDRFTGWAHGAIVNVIEEIRVSGTNRYEVLDRMKPFITNDTIQIEEKGRDHRTVPNFTSYMMLTNHKDAIPLTSGDRRYCVFFSRVQSEEQLYSELGGEGAAAQYFEDLFAITRKRPDALARYLLDYKVSEDFNPTGRAPDTRARQMMMDVSTSPERLALEDAIERNRCDVINGNILDITWLNSLCDGEGEEIPKTRTLTAILLEMGYEQIERKRIKITKTGRYHYVWCKGDIDAKSVVKNYFDGDDYCPF